MQTLLVCKRQGEFLFFIGRDRESDSNVINKKDCVKNKIIYNEIK